MEKALQKTGEAERHVHYVSKQNELLVLHFELQFSVHRGYLGQLLALWPYGLHRKKCSCTL